MTLYILYVFAARPRLLTPIRRLAAVSGALALVACGGALAAGPSISGAGATCPRKPLAVSTGSAAGHELVPARASRVLLCRYHFDKLEGRGLITRAGTIGMLTHEFDTLRAMPPGSYSCPADFGVYVSARFAYRQGGPDSVLSDETGCETVTNGQVRRWALYPPGPRLLRQLLTYSGCSGGRREPVGACS